MSKLALALVSLIAAIPAGILTVLLVLAFLGNAQNLPGMLWAVSVPTLLASVLLVAMPVGVLLFGPKTDAADQADEADVDSFDDEADAEVDSFDDEASSELTADAGDEFSLDEEGDDFDDATETVGEEGDDLFMEDDDFGLDTDEEK